ncbi:MAG TPA: LCP family protein [Candidatus Moranbacteria bacterium]|nr:LCP family protein [Candidatus Moranbacteria bacterium]
MKIKNIFIKLVFGLAFFIVFIGLIHGAFFIWKITEVENKINVKNDNSASFFGTFKNIVVPNKINLEKANGERINILLLGIAGKGKPGSNLADTIMIASLNTKTGKVALLSIPRDLYAEVPNTGYENKINTIYGYGLGSYPENSEKSMEPMKAMIKNITSLDIDYWVVLNFDGFQKAIDAIGGINITSERDIYDPKYPGPNYSYEIFELKKGFHHLDGATALKYARMRHDDPESDFGRAKRQQQVMQAVKNKIFSTGTLLNAVALNQLLNVLGENVKTNISSSELEDFIKLARKLDTDNINNIVLDAWKSDSLLKGSRIYQTSALIPRIGNWSEVQDIAQNIFDTNEIKRTREEIAKENASVILINKSGNELVLKRLTALLKDSFGYKNVVVLSDFGKSLENETFVYDLTGKNKPFTLNELIKKLPAKTSENLDAKYKKLIGNVSTDLVLVIGKDLIPRYSLAEVSFKDYNEDEN